MTDSIPPQTPPADPWWKHPENWTAIMTVGTLALTVCGYTISAEDQHTLIASGGGVAVGLVQVFGVLRRVLASRVS